MLATVMSQTRHYTRRETAFALAMRKIPVSFVLGMIAILGIIVLMTPGRTFDFMRGKISATAPVELVDIENATSIAFSSMNDVRSTEPLAHGAPPIADGPYESPKRDEKMCDDAMWSSFKGKCLSFAKHRKHRRKAIESAAYFAAH
jgi:hypothetical protein